MDIIEYSSQYCKIDCEVLDKGYNAFAEQISSMSKEYFKQEDIKQNPLDLDEFVSISQLSDTWLQRAGVYDGVEKVGLNVREFIQSAMVGGRVMTRNNKKKYVIGFIQDFDAVSLYPSSMVRLGGYLKGKAKLLKTLDYHTFKHYDGYFVEIVIDKVQNPYAFPLASFKTDKGTRSNNLMGKRMVVDKTTLEDLIEFQKIEYTVIRGYYYDEGRNYALRNIITYLFEQRAAAKKLKNPIQATYKLIMNSAYGKTLLKAHETESKHVKQKDLEKHVLKHYNHIKDFYPLNNNQWKVNHYKSVDNHFNNAHCGVEVLSTSKRIMNEVMCLAEDKGLELYYQDTDSGLVCLVVLCAICVVAYKVKNPLPAKSFALYITGQPGSGKTSALLGMLLSRPTKKSPDKPRFYYRYFDHIYLISNSLQTLPLDKLMLCPERVHNEFCDTILQSIIETERDGVNLNNCLIIDDCIRVYRNEDSATRKCIVPATLEIQLTTDQNGVVSNAKRNGFRIVLDFILE